MKRHFKHPEPFAQIGDLVFCHACGDSHGWILNQFALVKDVFAAAQSDKKDIRVYKIWIFEFNRTELIPEEEFEKKNLELVSRANGNNDDIDSIEILDIQKLTKDYLK